MLQVQWFPEPLPHTYIAAERYLSLILPPRWATSKVAELKEAESVTHLAKDLLRASCLAPLASSNRNVNKHLIKIENGELLAPVLLVRLSFEKMTIADGYHRVCAAYLLDEHTEVSCRIV